MELTSLIACHECGLLHRVEPLPHGAAARCTRCGAVLYREKRESLDRSLALAVAGLILFVLANAFPLLGLKLEGNVKHASLITGVEELYAQGWPELALVVLLTSAVIPLAYLLGMIFILFPLKLNRAPSYLPGVFRFVRRLQPWGMMEVFMLGILVSVVKLMKMATIVPGISLYCFALLIFVIAGSIATLDPRVVWERIPWGRAGEYGSSHGNLGVGRAGSGVIIQGPPRTGLLSCHDCGLLSEVHGSVEHVHAKCPRCGAALHRRKPNSISRTWALLISAAILYIPANVLPIMKVVSFGKGESDTIMSGVIYFIESGSWYLALLIFFASIVVPSLKIIVLSYLLISVQRRSHWRPVDRTRLYRITEAVGRWSMVDVYVVTLMVALVELGALASIEVGPGAVFFSGVVVLTMFAAMSFDPRLIWDAMESRHD
jgi:paraquat-inducible protein A